MMKHSELEQKVYQTFPEFDISFYLIYSDNPTYEDDYNDPGEITILLKKENLKDYLCEIIRKMNEVFSDLYLKYNISFEDNELQVYTGLTNFSDNELEIYNVKYCHS